MMRDTKIKKLQGKKKSISTFFDMSGDYMEKGVGTSGGVYGRRANVLGRSRCEKIKLVKIRTITIWKEI